MASRPLFQSAPIPNDEIERIEELRLLGLLDTGNEERFDRYTQLVADLFEVPIALISLVDVNRQWFKSACGLDVTETSRDVAFCAHAILESEILVVPDAIKDKRFAENPLVTNEPHVRFYAGAVLRGPTGKALGTLCLIDHQPRIFHKQEQKRLLSIAKILEEELRHESEYQKVRQEAFENALYDANSGLPNARLFRDRLEQALPVVRRTEAQLLVALVEVNGLFNVRTVLGNKIGDELLRECGQRLKAALNEVCTVAHWRDEVFAILLPSMHHKDEAVAFLDHIHNSLAKPFDCEGRILHFEGICGAASYPNSGIEADELIHNAGIALNDAKKDSHYHSRLYSPEMSTEMTRKIDLENQLIEAVRNQQLSIAFQPILDLETQEIHRVEALCRWIDPEQGNILADIFIPLAENSNLILDIDLFVISTAVSTILEWDNQGIHPLSISVNLSSKTLMHPQLVDWLKIAVIDKGLNPERVFLEVTENSLVADMGLARKNIATCRSLGFNAAIDDFGTGFSSFSYLKDLSIDELKLDRVFVKEMTQRRRDASIASNIITLAHDLGLTVVAEGIETYDQLAYLNAYQCEEGQGYYFSEPLEPKELLLKIKQNKIH